MLTGEDLSLEFLMGRALDNAMLNVGLKDLAKGASLLVSKSWLSSFYLWSKRSPPSSSA